MPIIRKCRYCGAEFEACNGAKICSDCKNGIGVSHPPRFSGLKDTCPSSVYKGSGYGKKCESETTINAILSEYDPKRGESPFDYGKISARVCK